LLLAVIVAYFVLQFLGAGPSPIDPQPKPGPVDPVDPPKPSPNEPDFSGYADKVYERAIKVKSRTHKADCEQLSGDIQNIIDRIDSGALATNPAIVDAMRAALLELPPAWYGQVKEILNKVFKPLTADKTLNSPKRWRALLSVAIKPGIDRAGAESTGVEPL
jgi:hypothetical protein